MKRLLMLGFMVLVLFPPTCTAQTCSTDAVQRAAEKVKAVQSRMLAMKGDEDGLNYDIAQGAGEQIGEIKDALATTIDEFMRCASGNALDPKAIEVALAGLLGANKPEVPFHPPTETTPIPRDHIYGADLRIKVIRPHERPQLRAVEASFEVGCGVDTLLLMYEWGGGG